MRAPSAIAASFAQTTSSATRPRPAEVSKPQSVPARTRRGSPTARATASMRSATTSGCSTKLVSGIDHAGDNHLIVVERKVLQAAVLVCVARIGEWQHEAANVGLAYRRQHLGQRHVAVVRTLVIAPAGMQP